VVLREHSAVPRTGTLRDGVPIPPRTRDDCMRIPTGARCIALDDSVAPAEAQQGVLRVRERTHDCTRRTRLRLKAGWHLCGDFRPGGLGILDIHGDCAVDLQLPEFVPAERL